MATAPKKPKTAKEMKDTLRYKHMVARLQKLQPYKKGAALMQEISKGSQWRMDAALEAIAPQDWQLIDVTQVMKQAAMFGRLTTINQIADTLGFEKGSQNPSYAVQDAFHVALLHGNYRTADALVARGADPNYADSTGSHRSVFSAVAEDDTRKIGYLARHGVDAGALAFAAVTANSIKALKYLVTRKNVSPDFEYRGTSLMAAADEAGHERIKTFLQESGAKPFLPVVAPVPVPAVTDDMLKGTAYQTSFDISKTVIITDAWKLPEIPVAFKAALLDVAVTEKGLDFTLQNGHKLQWNSGKNGGKEYIGSNEDVENFDDTDVKASVAGAVSRGWKTVAVHGTLEQREALWLEAMRNKIDVTNFTPEDGRAVKKTWEREQGPKPPKPA